MDKNTIWAIVLSTLVIVGSYFLLPKVFGTKNKNVQVEETVEVAAEQRAVVNEEQNPVAAEILTDTAFTEEENELLAQATEEKITINTKVAEVVFTTKGGDILSYKLIGHNDKDTNDYVQLSDNISEMNRTCSLAIGGAANTIINEIFSYE
nr:membrane protein insertase YidC [Treponema sp.]